MQGGRASFASPHIDHSLPGPGPAKRRKRNPGSQRHWDEPDQQSNALPYDEGEVDRTIEEEFMVDDAEEEEEESRELTHDEVWDDSALIAAWESATAEYEAYHGKGKGWKKESVKRWYNVPPDPSKKRRASAEVAQESGVTPRTTDPDENSRPLDFETFVPRHDPSLLAAQPSHAAFETYAVPPAPGEHVGRDEAFDRALGAMYWAGYWTAVYHSHGRDDRNGTVQEIAANGYDERQEDENAESEEEDEELLISTQR